jgi:hypothetical protein
MTSEQSEAKHANSQVTAGHVGDGTVSASAGQARSQTGIAKA